MSQYNNRRVAGRAPSAVGPTAHAGAVTPPTIAIGDAMVYEGNTGITPAKLVVTLSDPQSTDVVVDYTTVAGTATVGTLATSPDAAAQRAEFVSRPAAPQPRSACGSWPTPTTRATNPSTSCSRTCPRRALRFETTRLRSPSATTIPTAARRQPWRSATPRSMRATVGSQPRKITATLSDPQGSDVIVDFMTVNGSATGGTATSGADFVHRRGRIRFRAGKTSTVLAVRVNGDLASEADETFGVAVTATTPAGFALLDDTASITIVNDEPSPLPGLPTALAAVPGPLNRYLTASWEPPASGGPATGYDLEVVRASTTDVLTNVTSPTVFGCGLASVTDTCTLRVRAHNDVGNGDWSAPISASTWAPPSAPPNLVASGTSVSWDVPTSDQPVIDYWVFKSLNNGTTWTQVTTTTNQHAAAGCSICLVRVQGRSSVGFGAFSTVEVAFAPPTPPTALAVTRDGVNPALLHISWSPPLVATPAVDSYDVTINDFVFPIALTGITTTSVDYRMRNTAA